MSTQLTVTFNPVHQRENNHDSQAHLEQYRDKFSNVCWDLLKGLLQGRQYTTLGYNVDHHISSLPRRVKDLIDGYGIPVQREIATDADGNKLSHKVYYITEADRPTVLLKLIEKLQIKQAS
jgi:hypothetical protein